MMLTSSVQAVIANTPRVCTLVLFIKLHTHTMQVLTIYVLVWELALSDVNSYREYKDYMYMRLLSTL